MISVQDLQDSLYQDCYFTEQAHTLRVQNEQRRSDTPVLLYVDLHSSGSFIQIGNGILKKSQDIFRKEDKEQRSISFRSDCDGVCILNLEGRHILLFTEVKSGFNGIKNKGFEQLVASYIKIRCLLHTIDTYNSDDVEELAIVLSYPPEVGSEVSSQDVFASKTQLIAPSLIDRANQKYATALRVDHEVVIDLSDYNIGQCHINPMMYNPKLKVKFIPVINQALAETVDLDSII